MIAKHSCKIFKIYHGFFFVLTDLFFLSTYLRQNMP